MADEKKVMDVANPGEAKPNTGSKPMVIGHKSMATDPDVKTKEGDKAKTVPDKKDSPKKKVKLEPISNLTSKEKTVDKKDESASDLQTLETPSVTETKKPSEDTSAKENASETTEKPKESETSEPNSDNASEESKEKKQESIDEAQLAREEKLQHLIKSKKYNVQISHDHSSAFKTFVITFIVVLILGFVVVVVLIDAEVLDLGIDLPFNLI